VPIFGAIAITASNFASKRFYMRETKPCPLIPLATLAVAITTVAGLLSIYAASQEGSKVNISVAAPTPPALQGKAFGTVTPLELKSSDIKADILTHPMPSVSLLFTLPLGQYNRGADSTENQSTVIVSLPAEANKILLPYWKGYLVFSYKTELERVLDPQTQVNEDRAIGQVFKTTVTELQDLTIDAPNGTRKISQDEAYDIVRFVGLSASGVVAQAKKHNQ
jgi:hypothetical protein